MRIWAILLAALPALTGLGVAQEAVTPTKMTLRITPGVNAAVLAFLAERTVPIRMPVVTGEKVEPLLRKQYGLVNPVIADWVRRYNPTIDGTLVATTDGEIVLPSGIRWLDGGTVEPPAGAGLQEIAIQNIGNGGDSTVGRINQVNRQFRRGGQVQAGANVHLPFRVLPVTVELRPEFVSQRRAIAEAVAAMDPKHVFIVAYDADVPLTKPLDSSEVTDAGTDCSEASRRADWPFNVHDVATALLRTRQAGEIAGIAVVPAVVAIADNGMPSDESRFPFWTNDDEQAGQDGIDEDVDDYLEDLHGVNVVKGNTVTTPPATGKAQDHGTGVAGLVLGGSRAVSLSSEVWSRIQIMVLKITEDDGPSAGHATGDAIDKAITYAYNHTSNIINLSLEKPGQPPGLIDKIRGARTLLFVAAAGNAGKDLGVDAVYAGDQGAILNENVISVAAHDDKGSRPMFSNFGPLKVDLAAPGCQVPSVDPDGAERLYTGTSFAAPLVTFVAALLYSEGVRKPWQIKQQILRGVDPDPNLRGLVWSEGRLNIVKALSLYEDLVETSDHTIVRGTIVEPTALRVRNVSMSLRGEIAKIVPNYSNETGKGMRVALVKSRVIEFVETDTDLSVVKILNGDTGKVETYPVQSVRDIVIRSRQGRTGVPRRQG